MSGVCAAIASARNGAKTALVHNRPVLGGNASSEIKVSVNGACRCGEREHVLETGIIMELLLKNKSVNPIFSFYTLDHVTLEMVRAEENIDLYLNTQMQSALVKNQKIESIIAYQLTTSKQFLIGAHTFIDTTGDANLAYESGADYTIGREAASTYGESLAPIVADTHTMGSTILFTTKDMGRKMPFTRPNYAYEVTKESLGSREIYDLGSGYWWVEVGGDDLSTIEDAEEIREELIKYAYGVFDYIKNSGEFEADNLVIDWIGSLPGKRESRRILGDYVLNQNDLAKAERFKDCVAYGGWTMDDHSVGGIRAKEADSEDEGTKWHPLDDVYSIPYRSLYSRNITNLLVGGRCISASHMAMSSTRVIATCAVIGQAVGTAAYLAARESISVRQVADFMEELQQRLIKQDAYLPGIEAKDPFDLATKASTLIRASSALYENGERQINGPYARKVNDQENAWISEPISEEGEWIELVFETPKEVKEILLCFDPNLSKPITPSIATSHKLAQEEGMPSTLVKSFELVSYLADKEMERVEIKDNILRVVPIDLGKNITCDRIRLTVTETYGDSHARVFNFRVYEN